MKNILVIGGAGYVGSSLVRKLLIQNYNVIVYDLFLYKENVFEDLKNSKNLKCIKGDIRNISKIETCLDNIDCIIHLACISNDPSYELNPDLGKSINFECFYPLLKALKKFKINKFLYASSSSVYGEKKEDSVTEELKLEPLTDYSHFKVECENILRNFNHKNLEKIILRPATVCGYSKRQRLDVIVNILSNHAYFNKKIIVHGGNQLRPNIHIDDMCDAYIHLLNFKNDLNNEIFNVGFENHSVTKLAQMTKDASADDVKISTQKVFDERSYKINSNKIVNKTEFKTKKTVQNAIEDLIKAFQNRQLVDTFDDDSFYNIQIIKKKIDQLI